MNFLKTALILIISFLVACSPGTRGTEQQKKLVIFPSPPDTARIQYLTSFSSSKDITGEQSIFSKYVMGEETPKNIQKPYGISVRNKRIYICDSMLPGLEIIDLEKNTFNYFMPDGLGELKKPINCFVTASGDIFVADAERRQIVAFSALGNFTFVLGDGKNGKPTDVNVFDEKIWVCDLQLHKIIVFDKNTRKELYRFPEAHKKEPAYLFMPTNITIADGIVYVTDTGSASVKKYKLDGTYLGEVGGRGNSIGSFVRPKGLAVDHNRNLYVVDAAFENVQIFNQDDQALMYFGGTYKGPGYMWLPAAVAIDYEHMGYFKKYVHHFFDLQYLIFVSNQYGPDKVSVYGFVSPKSGLSAK